LWGGGQGRSKGIPWEECGVRGGLVWAAPRHKGTTGSFMVLHHTRYTPLTRSTAHLGAQQLQQLGAVRLNERFGSPHAFSVREHERTLN
jgi:hypothetical protein